MILNKGKLIPQNKSKIRDMKNKINENKKEKPYLQNVEKLNNTNYDENRTIPHVKTERENINNISSSDEPKNNSLKFILKQHKKAKINTYTNKYKTNINNSLPVGSSTEPDFDSIKYNDSRKNEFINPQKDNTINSNTNANANANKNKIFNKKLKANNMNSFDLRNKLYKNISEKVFPNNENNKMNTRKIWYTKIMYNKNKNKKKISEDNYNNNLNIENGDMSKKESINYKSTIDNIQENDDLNEKINRNNTIDVNDTHSLKNNNKFIVDDMFYKITRKSKILRPVDTRKKSLNLINANNNNNNQFESKTINNFYVHRKPNTYSVSVSSDQNHLIKRSEIYDLNNPQSYLNQDNFVPYLNMYNSINKTLDSDNKRKILQKKNMNRKNQKIRIINNGAIKEFNISFPGEERSIGRNNLTEINNSYIKDNNYNFLTINTNNNDNLQKKKNELFEDYNKYYIRNIPPININQFNINASTGNNSVQNFTENNIGRSFNSRYDSEFYDDFWTQRNTYSKYKDNIILPNDINNHNNNSIDNKRILNGRMNNLIELNREKSRTIQNDNKLFKSNKVLVKKRPLNEIRLKNASHKKFQNLKFTHDNPKNIIRTNLTEGNYNNINTENNNNDIQPKNTIYMNKNNNNNNNLKLCSEILNFMIEPEMNYSNNKDLDDNIKKIIDDRSQNIIIIKKDKDKIINKIIVEENIDSINKEIEKEYLTVENLPIKVLSLLDYNILKNKENILNEENNKLKTENKLLAKRDKMKEDLIKKLDKEKQNLIEEINKLTKENNEQKIINEKLMNENDNLKEENIKINNSLNEMLKGNKSEVELFELDNIGGLNFNVDIESINDGQIEKIDDIKESLNQEDKEEK